jgi:hypothetical protein
MNLLGTHQAGAGWKAFTAIFLFGWGSGVIARIPPVPAVGGQSSMASGTNRSPSRERMSLKWHGLANLKNLAPGSAR